MNKEIQPQFERIPLPKEVVKSYIEDMADLYDYVLITETNTPEILLVTLEQKTPIRDASINLTDSEIDTFVQDLIERLEEDHEEYNWRDCIHISNGSDSSKQIRFSLEALERDWFPPNE
jgi:hypothetical protein